MKIRNLFLVTAILSCSFLTTQASVSDDFNQLEQQLDSSILDVYGNQVTPQTVADLNRDWKILRADTANVSASIELISFSATTTEELAAQIGKGRALLQHVAALEMLENQRAGNVKQAQEWRDFITLPQFADADEGALLLQQAPAQVRQAGVTQALAKEYISWQVSRTRQLLDRFRRAVAEGGANDAFIRENIAEIQTLSRFPQSLLHAAGLNLATTDEIAIPHLTTPYNSPESMELLAAWQERLEATLPDLLSPSDISRFERLLARFVDLIPKEYSHGVQDGRLIIPLELREAQQFTQKAQELTDELAPSWRRDHQQAYDQYHSELVKKFSTLQAQLNQIVPVSDIESTASDISSLLTNRFGLSARQTGEKGQVVEETALEVRVALANSLAAAEADRWDEAESLRLDAYTAFDSEIEIRVLPRNPTMAREAERSFIDGQDGEQGIKALLDRHAPVEELTAGYERALKNLDECAAVLKVAVSPGTIGFTAFTIIGREGLEAMVILAALLAGLRGEENRLTRRYVVSGAGLAVVVSLLTFWLSQTVVQSLIRYGEKLEAVVSILAVAVLLMVTNWVFHKFYWVEWNARLRKLSKAAQEVRAPKWEMFALLGVGFLTVYREGFETTIFMQSLLLEGGKTAVSSGVLAGFLFVGTIAVLVFLFGMKMPYRKLLIITGILVVSIMTTFLGSTVRLFQTVGWLHVHPIAGLQFPYWVGLWFGLYPSWEGILIPPLALVYVGGAWLYLKLSSKMPPKESIVPIEKSPKQMKEKEIPSLNRNRRNDFALQRRRALAACKLF